MHAGGAEGKNAIVGADKLAARCAVESPTMAEKHQTGFSNQTYQRSPKIAEDRSCRHLIFIRRLQYPSMQAPWVTCYHGYCWYHFGIPLAPKFLRDKARRSAAPSEVRIVASVL